MKTLEDAANAIKLLEMANALNKEECQHWASTCAQWFALNAQQAERIKDLEASLSELHSIVWGESPGLLNEDSGGDAALDYKIRKLLAAKETA